MKPKLILIAGAILIASGAAVFSGCNHNTSSSDEADIAQLITHFSGFINAGKTDSALACFEMGKKSKIAKEQVNILAGKNNLNGTDTAIFKITIDGSKNSIATSGEFGNAITEVVFKGPHTREHHSSIKITVHKIAPHQYKIKEIQFDLFSGDYVSYANDVYENMYTNKDIYDPITLKAFENAKKLKSTYDSVLWFAHVNKQTYYYVGKGKWEDIEDATSPNYKGEKFKMGLVAPDMKEIIPAQFDLVYAINGTFDGLVEVEKNQKHGFYNLTGKPMLPVDYDQILVLNDGEHLAVLRKGDDYYYLQNDTTVSEKADLQVADFVSKIKFPSTSFKFVDNHVMMEHNSRETHSGIYIAPSYLADLNVIGRSISFINPLRHHVFQEAGDQVETKLISKGNDPGSNWVQTAIYSVKEHFLNGRADFYDTRSLVVADKARNRILGQRMNVDYSPEALGAPEMCNESGIKVITDSLFEVKLSAVLYLQLYNGSSIDEGPYYHYLTVRNGRLVELNTRRRFTFTKFVQMNESYLNGCYSSDKKLLSHASNEMLRFMKNEIYADYQYQFKDKKWNDIFSETMEWGQDSKTNINVDDSLTAIDKYNIDWINKRLKKTNTSSLAAK